jgi:hypothetical protein
MLKTGIDFIDGFSQLLVFLPLLPVMIILLRRVYHAELILQLMVLCLLQFLPSIILQNIAVTPIGRQSVINIFSLLELLIYLKMFRVFFDKPTRKWLDIVVIALLSAMLTYYIMRGTGQVNEPVKLLQNGFIVVLILAGLPQLVKHFDLRIFQSALFWISAGTLFYLLMWVLVAWAATGQPKPQINMHNDWDKTIILNMAGFIRYVFYCLAALLYRSPKHHKNRERD